MEIKELREKRAALLKQAADIRAAHKDTGKPIPAEDMAKAIKALDEADEVRKQIAELEAAQAFDKRMKDAEDELRSSQGRKTDPGSGGEQRGSPTSGSALQVWKSDEYRNAFGRFLRGGEKNLTEEQRSILCRGNELQTPEQRMDTQTGAAGGFTVAPLFYNQMTDAMKDYTGVEQAGATEITTDTGAALPFPTNDDTAGTARIIGETAAVNTNANLVVGQTSIGVFMYVTDVVLVSLQLLQDSAFPIDTYIAGKLAERMGRKLNRDWTIGAGTTEPRGIVTAMGTSGAGIGVTTVANNAFTADEVLALQHSVDVAYRNRPGVGYAFNDNTYQRIRLLKDTTGRYLLKDPGDSESATLWNKPFRIFSDMASLAASTNIMLFGDMRYYHTRKIRTGVNLFRFDQLYMPNLQIGFLAYGRYGGDYVNPGNAPVKAMRTAA